MRLRSHARAFTSSNSQALPDLMAKTRKKSTRAAAGPSSNINADATLKRRKRNAPSQPQAASPASNDQPQPESLPSPSLQYKRGTIDRKIEEKLSAQYPRMCGVDEVGRGPLAGPVVACACLVPLDVEIEGINDSKLLTERQREAIYEKLTTHPQVHYTLCSIDEKEIDKINILQASLKAMSNCINELHAQHPLDVALVDGNILPTASLIPQQAYIKGDQRVHCIAAASIIAKVTRDRMMLSADQKWPLYGFASHKGYGSAAHMKAIRDHGPCAIHRMTFAPMKNLAKK